jgi:hypothetical protein
MGDQGLGRGGAGRVVPTFAGVFILKCVSFKTMVIFCGNTFGIIGT